MVYIKQLIWDFPEKTVQLENCGHGPGRKHCFIPMKDNSGSNAHKMGLI